MSEASFEVPLNGGTAVWEFVHNLDEFDLKLLDFFHMYAVPHPEGLSTIGDFCMFVITEGNKKVGKKHENPAINRIAETMKIAFDDKDPNGSYSGVMCFPKDIYEGFLSMQN